LQCLRWYSPDEIKIRKIIAERKETGIDQLDRNITDVAELHLEDPRAIRAELIKRAKVFDYVPTKKIYEYADALMEEYQQFKGGGRKGSC
jgi:hypothetical protein